jgi:HAD superfamily hydrolase (TIGR01490 family)
MHEAIDEADMFRHGDGVGAIAFFDLDKTLLSVNSATLWIRRELSRGNISRVQALRAGLWVGLYSLGVIRADDVVRVAIKALKGKREREIIERTLDFWRDDVAHTIRPGAHDAIARHRAQGDLLFLLTSSSNYMSARASDLFKLDGFLANRFEVTDGIFTGEPIEPVCFGVGKLALARATADKLNVALTECSFYTDSLSDLPVLEVVGTPVAVNPDPRLRRVAKKRGWRIEDWGVAGVRALPSNASPPSR